VTGLLVAGTTSDAGKSVVATGLCRAFRRRGIDVAPYKAQNMSNNSMVCAGGGEIGRAQWIQARAAGVEPDVTMNPVLLKPGSDLRSHVVVLGEAAGTISAGEWDVGRAQLAQVAYDAYDRLAAKFEVVVAEGAGSPTEINLRAGDFVNMGLARHGDLPTVVVGDIDRGGLFAAFYGTVALLEPADQALVAGFVVNKFRGDRALLEPGLAELAGLTGRPTYGVLPWHPALWLDSEDALDLDARRTSVDGALRVAVVRLPRISNFTDVDALGLEPDLDVVFAASPRDLAGVDLVVLPGTRATIADLDWLRQRGLDDAIVRHARRGGSVLGICGGAQMLGGRIDDPLGVESAPGTSLQGLGLVDVTTTFEVEKVLGLVTGSALGEPVAGYEIHHGHLDVGAADPFTGGARADGVFATMWHGSLESDGFRQAFLADVAARAGRTREPSEVVFEARRAARLDLLGDLVEEHLDVDALIDLARNGPGAGLPVLAPGSARR
jgi:adenosylcobyric acid synthase